MKFRAICLLLCAACAALLSGCPNGQPEDSANPSTSPPPPVRLMVIGDDGLAAAIQREWNASGRGELELNVVRPDDLEDVRRLPADAVIYPGGMLGDLAERGLITALPDWTADDDQLRREEFFPLVRTAQTMWGHELVAVPFGAPQLVIFYRTDVLEKLDRQPPQTWREFDELAALVAQSKQIDDLPGVSDADWQPVAQPLAKGWAGQMLLARAAPYVRNPNQYSGLFDYQTMEPMIDQRPFVRALEELVRTATPASLEDTPATVRQKLLRGRCSLAITWPTRTIDWPEGEQAADVPLGCVEMPGSKEFYNFEKARWETRGQPQRASFLLGGYLGSVSTSARHTRSAAEALVWLAGVDTGKNIALASEACSMSRNLQLKNAQSWIDRDFGADVAGQFAEAMQAANSRSLWLHSPRVPGRKEYLAVLDEAVRSAVLGENTPQLALAEAAARWRQITEKYGVKKQRDAYMRSLGLEP